MNNQTFEEVDHSIFDLLDWVRNRPAIWLDDDRSIKRVRSFLVGYECGLGRVHYVWRDHAVFHSFSEWVASKLNFPEPTSGWHNMILARAGNDEKAYELFFSLLDEFRLEKGINAKQA